MLVLENDVDHVLLEPIEVSSNQLDWLPQQSLQVTALLGVGRVAGKSHSQATK